MTSTHRTHVPGKVCLSILIDSQKESDTDFVLIIQEGDWY